MKAGRIALLVVGVIVGLWGFGTAVAGAGTLWLNSIRDSDGYFSSPAFNLESDGYAVTTETAQVHATAPGDWAPWIGGITTRLQAEAPTERAVFIGIGPRDAVAGYLDGVAHDEITRIEAFGESTYRDIGGERVPAPPAEQSFWSAQAVGTGAQSLDWDIQSGDWVAVVMNADGSRGVGAEVTAAVQTDVLWPIGLGLLIGGLVLLGIGAALVLGGALGMRDETAAGFDGSASAPGLSGSTPAPVGAGSYPLTLDGRLDEPLSRGLWLVKWLLALPHYLILGFLWVAYVMLTVFAGFAILFTGRYPRGLFDINVGILRWTWRVAFYSYSALGTDQYPPFTLQPADYPAALDVAYPERLSRGLVLVKWWLLAIPHLIIIGIFAGGMSWTFGDANAGGWQVGTGTGLIGLLTFVAALVLLFTARYPAALFDFIMGLNRWVYRVIAYVSLMTDQYPPFRLDAGGSEPRPVEPPPPGGAPTSDEAQPHLTNA